MHICDHSEETKRLRKQLRAELIEQGAGKIMQRGESRRQRAERRRQIGREKRS
jgi:hypothetical protein